MGNGRLGAMVFGDPTNEHLVLNEFGGALRAKEGATGVSVCAALRSCGSPHATASAMTVRAARLMRVCMYFLHCASGRRRW